MAKLTKSVVDAAKPEAKPYFVWCSALPGFGCRVYPTGKRAFYIDYRNETGDRKRMKLGDYGKITLDDARRMALAALGAVVAGDDPLAERVARKNAMTVSELCERYMQAARAGLVMTRFGKPKRASTLAIDEGRISRHIVPLIGTMRADALTRADVQRMVDSIAAGATAGRFKTGLRGLARVDGGAGTAGRVVELLGGVWTWAERRGLVEGANPSRGVERCRGEPKRRVLSDAELAALGAVMREYAPVRPAAIAALRLIALSGLRREEACGLRWVEVDAAGSCLRLAQTKTGASMRPLGAPAVALLASLPRRGDFVFPSADGSASADMKKAIAALFDAAGLPDARSHDLRRTYATKAAELGFGDGTIGEMIGHAARGVTGKHYIRRPDAALIAAADATARAIEDAMSHDSRAASGA